MDSTLAPTLDFERHRRRLQGIAYRMLGSVAEAEDVVQDAWLRWHEWQRGARDTLDSAEAWLVTVVTRLSIDRLRSAQRQREHYAGHWLPEPLLTGGDAADAPHGMAAMAESPEQALERAHDVSVAFLAVLERLAPEARAAFLLREVFDTEYDEIARTLDKSEAACRQLVHRAKAQVQAAHVRHAVPRERQQALLRGFAEAATRGDLQALKDLLAEDARLVGDGGGKVAAFPRPLVGAQRLAQLYFAATRRHGHAVRYQVVELNGQPALLRFIEGRLESAASVETDGTRILRIDVQRNPDKLARIRARFEPGAADAAATAVVAAGAGR